MVAIAASALTADVFLQMTATLAHISKLQNTTKLDNDKFNPINNGSLTFFDVKRGEIILICLVLSQVNLKDFSTRYGQYTDRINGGPCKLTCEDAL